MNPSSSQEARRIPTSTSPLLSLPAEVLQLICEYVDSSRMEGNLSAFCLANSECYASAASCLFRTITIHACYTCEEHHPVKVAPILAPDIAGWQALLQRRLAYRHVRRLKIKEKHIGMASIAPAYHPNSTDSSDDFADPPERGFAAPFDLEWTEHYIDDAMASWESLAALIHQFTALADLIWDCSWPLAPCVQAALQSRPAISLHLDAFWFRHYVRYDDLSLPEFEMLVTSQLRSITARSFGYSYGGDEDYTNEAILALISGVNPHIRRASFLSDTIGISGQYAVPALKARKVRRAWPGLTRVSPKSIFNGRSSLTSLEIGGESVPSLELFNSIFEECDLCALKVLKLRVPINYKGLGWLTTHFRSSTLTSLVLGVRGTLLPGPELSEDNLAAAFILSLPPLKALNLVSDIEQSIFDSALEIHGTSLRRLWFPPPQKESRSFFNAERVDKLQRFCPFVEELALSIPRSRGDSIEMSMYKSLGRLARLASLALTLDCEDTSLDLRAEDCDPTPIYPDFNDFDRQYMKTSGFSIIGQGRRPRNGHQRLAIMNAALDKRLALDIFHHIARAKPGFPTDLALRRLELRPVRGCYVTDAVDVMRTVSKWWLIQLRFSDANLLEPIATRIRSPGDVDDEELGPPTDTLDDQMEVIFRKIWPEGPESRKSWSEDWNSLPLVQ